MTIPIEFSRIRFMKKLITVALAASLISINTMTAQADLKTRTSVPTDWTDVVRNADGIAYSAWKKSAEKIESSTSKLGEIEIVISPNAVPDNPVPLVALNLVSRLSANYAQPKKVVIAYVDEKDIAWGQKQIDEFCVGLTCGYDVSREAKKACNVPTTPCWGGLALRNQRTNITMIYATASEWGKSDPGHTSGTLEAHEYFHTIQSLLLANGGWTRVPRWLIEGGATFVGGAAVFHNDFTNYEVKRYRENHKTLSSSNRSAEWIEKFLDPNYTTGWNKWNGNEYEHWDVYDVGSLASEVLVSIGGIDKFLDILKVTGSGKSFAQAFESIYGISWREGAKIIANAIVAQRENINTRTPVPNLDILDTAPVPTLAILDTALDTSIPSIKSRLVAEVCILDWASCPNKTKFMEGVGASTIPLNVLSKAPFNHGTQMVSAALKANPNLNIVFVRIVGNTKYGKPQSYGINTLVNALTWVNNNKSKYNIVAVASSNSTYNPVIRKSATSNYCLPTRLDSVISTLNNSGIPAFFPTGNSGLNTSMKDKIEWPACIPQSIAVGGVDTINTGSPKVSLTSNYDEGLIDLWGEVQLKTIYPGNIRGYSYGTSVSVQVIAAQYVKLKSLNPTYTVEQLIALMKSSSVPVQSLNGQNVLLFDILRATNG